MGYRATRASLPLFPLNHLHQLIKSPCFNLSIRREFVDQIGEQPSQLGACRIW